jgi:hypothetical protein
VWFVDPKIRVRLKFMTLRLITQPYQVNGFEAPYRRWCLANTPSAKVYWFKDVVLGCLETWGLAFLGWSDGYEEIFICYGTFSIHDGSRIRFWEDNWLDNAPLQD